MLACSVCNRSKSNTFPEGANGDPLLIDPCNEDPEGLFSYNVDIGDSLGGQIESEGDNAKGEATIREINLKDIWHQRHRKKALGEVIKSYVDYMCDDTPEKRDAALEKIRALPFVLLSMRGTSLTHVNSSQIVSSPWYSPPCERHSSSFVSRHVGLSTQQAPVGAKHAGVIVAHVELSPP